MHTTKELAENFTKFFRKRTLINMEVISGNELRLTYVDPTNPMLYYVEVSQDGVDEILKLGLAARSLFP